MDAAILSAIVQVYHRRSNCYIIETVPFRDLLGVPSIPRCPLFAYEGQGKRLVKADTLGNLLQICRKVFWMDLVINHHSTSNQQQC